MFKFSLQLLDLCILDINSLDYQYGVLAAAAFCHFTSIETVQKVSGKTMNLNQIFKMASNSWHLIDPLFFKNLV